MRRLRAAAGAANTAARAKAFAPSARRPYPAAMTDPRRPIPTPAPSTRPQDGRPILALAEGLRFTVGARAGEVNILRGVDLALQEGEAVGLVGPSGSGKTTLLLLLAGLERPTAGRLVVAGHDLSALSEEELARFRRETIGIVFQAFHLVPTMTALENVAVPLEFAGRADAFARARAALEAVGLGHRLSHYPAELSGGEQQHVAVARAFVAEPRLILADEPTGNLDRATGERVMELLFSLRARRGTTLLLITHDPALAARCDRVLHIEDGVIRP